MTDVLLHLATTAEWRGHLAAGRVVPTVAGFVHLSRPEQVALPASRLFAGRTDLNLLVLDPDRIGVDVRDEPGLPTDPASMRFPHAYGPVPTSAVLTVLPYRPEFGAPRIPPVDAAGRAAAFEASLLRRAATTEVPVTGGVAVRTAPSPASRRHNQLLVDAEVHAADLLADADRVLDGLPHRAAQVRHGSTAAGLAAAGWEMEEVVEMTAPAGGPPGARVTEVGLDDLRPMWDAGWRTEDPGVDDETVRQLADRYHAEAAACDQRYLAVCDGVTVVASCVLTLDGATAWFEAVATDPAHREAGHGDALLAHARAVAGAAGCDLLALAAAAAGWSRLWYSRRGFTEAGRFWSGWAGPCR